MNGWSFLTAGLRRRGLGTWLLDYARQAPRRWSRPSGEVHLLLCVADHFEPNRGDASALIARRRVDRWLEEYPRRFAKFRDSDGLPPRHTFFYPLETYAPEHLDALAGLCRAGFGEVEVHLHHDRDTAEGLRRRLLDYKELLARRHGLLARHRLTGELAYGFVHGNWALDNSRPDGCWCGVDDELTVLRETGCYADFTMPAAPDPAQTRKINSLYYAQSGPGRQKGHDTGFNVGSRKAPDGALLLVQGPLLLDWRRRKWGVLPRLENGCIQGSQPPRPERIDLWLRAGIRVPTRPDWYFVKLHTHGANEANQPVLLGEPMECLHANLAARSRRDSRFHFHYVTARETYNLVKAAEVGWRGTVDGARDFQLLWNGATP